MSTICTTRLAAAESLDNPFPPPLHDKLFMLGNPKESALTGKGSEYTDRLGRYCILQLGFTKSKNVSKSLYEHEREDPQIKL